MEQVAKKQRERVSGLVNSPKDKPQTFVSSLIDYETPSALAMAYVCIQLGRQDEELGAKIEARIKSKLDGLRSDDFPQKADFSDEIVPMNRWLDFLAGFELGRKDVQDED